MRSKRPDPEKVIITVTIFYLLTSGFRGYILFRQNRLDSMYGEFDAAGINTAADFSDFIDSHF